MDDPKTIGIIGSFIVGAAGFIFGIYQYFDKKRGENTKLRVSLKNGAATGPLYPNGISEAMLILAVANIGNKTAIINAPI